MKNLKIILLSLVSVLVISSCVKDDEEDFGSGPHIVGFKNAQGSYIYTDNDVDPVVISEPINLIGGSNGTTSSENISMTISVDPSSTAIAGTEYTINTTAALTIPAGSDFVQLPITVNPAVLPGNVPKTIVINLTQVSTGNAVISDAKKSITITIAKCASDLAGTYSLSVTRIDNSAVYTFPNEVITQLALGVYETSTTGPYDDLTLDGAPRNGFIFKDVCQTIVVEEQNLGDFYSNLVFGNPNETNQVTLDTESGNVVSITMNYTITFAAGDRQFRAVYTKL
jgi:hypothetical protein